MKKQIFIIAILAITLFLSSCLDREYYKISVPPPTPDISIPLVHLNSTLGEIAENASDNTRVEVDSDGRLTFYYEGQVLRRSSIEVFPPIPWFNYFPIVDSVAPLDLPIDSSFIIKKGVFKQSQIRFRFRSTLQEDITVKMRMPELSKDGVVFEKNFEMNYDGSYDYVFESEDISLDGYDVNTTDSKLYFNYDARTEGGERIVFDQADMFIDIIRFSYMEGFFGNREYPLTGSAIPIGIFNNWLSGGFSFDEPELTIGVDNSFGFPVSVFFSRLDLTTLSGNIFQIESTAIDEGITFDYPEITEGAVVKNTSFSISADNSNIEQAFNEKATMVNYDILAVANPPLDNPIIGFFNEESFFSINTSIKLPMHTNIDDLVLSQNFELDLEEFDQVESGELILTIRNGLPLNADLQILFEDEANIYQDYILEGDWTKINASDQEGQGAEAQMLQVFRFNIDETSWDNIRQSKRMQIKLKLNTQNMGNDDYIWLYNYHGIDLKVSATINQ